MSSDDDVGAFFRSEIPAPGPGYFEQIEALTRAIDAETDTHSGEEVPENHPDDVQTSDNLVRLMDMRNPETRRQPRRPLLPLLVGVAAAVLAVTAGIATLNRDSTVVQVNPADAADAADQTSDGSDGASEQGIENNAALEVAEGSFWITIGQEPIRGLLSPAGEPADSRFSPYPLIASGDAVEVEGRVWLETQAFREQAASWYPVDALEKVADPVPNTEPTATLYVDEETIEPDLRSGSVFGVSETIRPGDVLASTGIRVVADDVVYVLIDSEIPFWIADELVIDIGDDGIEGFDRRQCFGDAERLLVLDFSADALTFTARFDFFDAVVVASGRRPNTADPQFTVATAQVGSGEESSGSTPQREQWEGTNDGIDLGERGSVALVGCDTVADRIAALEALVSSESLLPIPD